MGSFLTSHYVPCGIGLLVIPLLQIRLHRRLSQIRALNPALAGRQNHLLLLIAIASGAEAYYFVDPEANIRIPNGSDLPISVPGFQVCLSPCSAV
jgi:hypothetical protein